MRNRVLVIGGLCLLAALGVLWFLSNYERVPYKERVGPSNEVRLRQFLAAERFAARMGVPASEIRSLPELDSLTPGGALLMPARRQALEPRRLGQILAWVDRGGHLIVEAEFAGVSDPLLELLAVRRSTIEGGSGKPLLIDVGDGRRLAVSLPTRMGLQPQQAGAVLLRAGPADAPQLVSYRRGSGFVTVATSLQFARNRLIGENDHAEFLWQLLNLNRATPTLQVYHRPERLSLSGFLREHAPEALGACLALLAAVALAHRAALRPGRARRAAGAPAPARPPARERPLLLGERPARRAGHRGARRRAAAPRARPARLRRRLRNAEKVSRLASLTGISEEEASRFLAAGGPMHGADFIKLAQHAQRMHAALEKGKK